MTRGRPPKPLERQRATARNASHKSDGRELAKPLYTLESSNGIPSAPRTLGRKGRAEWRKVWESGPWLSVSQDYHWILMISQAYDDIEAFRKRVEEDGLIQTGSLGQPIAHPLIGEIRKCEATIRHCLSIIGFSPTDRARLGLAEVKKETALQEYIAAVRANERKANG